MKKAIVAIVIMVLLGGLIGNLRQKASSQEALQDKPKAAQPVEARGVAESKEKSSQMTYPAIVATSDQAKIVAEAGGTAVQVNFEVGDRVTIGKRLVVIDDKGLAAGEAGFGSSQVQQLEKALEQADEAYDAAKESYEDQKNDQNKSAKKIAKLQKESAQLAVQSAINDRVSTAPITGVVTQKSVSVGDSVSAGQPLATISKDGQTKVQFFVSPDEVEYVKPGTPVKIKDSEGTLIDAKVDRVAPEADAATRRFKVEVKPTTSKTLLLGTVVDVITDRTMKVADQKNLMLELSAITIAQNERYVFVADNGIARKVDIVIARIDGETAEISGDLKDSDQIIIKGNKLLKDGDQIDLKQTLSE